MTAKPDMDQHQVNSRTADASPLTGGFVAAKISLCIDGA